MNSKHPSSPASRAARRKGSSWRIPASVRLPFMPPVKIKQVPFEGPHLPIARWRFATRTIELDTHRPLPARRADLIHELEHAFADWKSDVLFSRRVDVRA